MAVSRAPTMAARAAILAAGFSARGYGVQRLEAFVRNFGPVANTATAAE